MQLADLFEQLSHGELRHVFAGLDGLGDIEEGDKARIISFANRGLKRLYTRFIHSKGFINVQLDPTINKYVLSSLYAASNEDVTNTNPRYILDSVEDPFLDDLVKVLVVRNEDTDFTDQMDIRINDRDGSPRVRTLTYNELFVKDPQTDFFDRCDQETVILTLEYQKLHPKIEDYASGNEPIVLLPLLEEALVFFVSGRIFSAMPSESNMIQAQTCFKEYERLCLMTEEDDLAQESFSEEDTKLENRGFM